MFFIILKIQFLAPSKYFAPGAITPLPPLPLRYATGSPFREEIFAIFVFWGTRSIYIKV